MNNLSPLEAQNVAAKMVHYRKDFRAFAQEQLHLGQGPIRFWPCQLPLIESIERQFADRGFARCVWLKARQVGASTLAQCFVAWRTMLWPNVNAIVIADESERARTLFEICRSFYDHMDDSIRPVGRYVTKRELVFANPSHITRSRDPGLRSRIVVDSAHKKNIAIGSAWTVAHLSEAARFRDPNVVLDGVIPAVHMVPGTLIIIESSAEMAGTWYRDFCEEAQRGKNAFEFSFVPWFLQPEYFVCPICRRIFPQVCTDPIGHAKEGLKRLDVSPEERHLMAEYKLQPGHINWMRGKFSEFGNDWNLFRQNYPITPEDAWITPGVQVFPSKQLKMFREMAIPPKRLCEIHAGPRILDSPHGRLKIWKEPEAGRSYDIGVDVASGVGEDDETSTDDLDNSVACVIERGNNEQVAEWVSRAVDPYALATTLYWLGKYYHDGQVAVETNAIGGATNAQLSKLGYSNCLTPDHKVLTTDMRWMAIGDLKEGDELLGFDEKLPGPHWRRRYKQAVVVGCTPRREVVYRIVLSDGTEFKATGEHLWLMSTAKAPQRLWRATRDLRVGNRFPKLFSPWPTLQTYDAGWLAGIMDGEGSAGFYNSDRLHTNGIQTHLSINQNPGLVLDQIRDLLLQWGFHFSEGHEGADSSCMRIRVSRKAEVARLLGMVRPKRLLPKVTPEWFRAVTGFAHAEVVAVEKMGVRDIVTFGTTTQTYVVDGFPTHNCYLWRYRDEIVPRYSKKTGWECVVPESKILTANLRWVEAQQLKAGDSILGCREHATAGKGGSYRLAMQTISGRQPFTAPLIQVRLSNGQLTTVSSTHPFLATRKSLGKARWIQASDLRAGDIVKYIPMWGEHIRTYDAGRLSAFLDGEGHLSHAGPTGLHMMISQAEGPLAQEINELWAELGFDWTFKWVRHKKRPHEKPIATSGLIRLTEILRALGILRPTRLLRVFSDHIDISRQTTRSFISVPVESVKHVGKGTVIGFTTSPDHTLIADGIIGHNTNPRSKPWLVGFAVHEAVNSRVIIRSELLVREMEAFVQKGPREWGAVAGTHDDRVMAWMIGLLASDDENFERYYGIRKEIDGREEAGVQKRKPNSWEADLTFGKNKDKEDPNQPWE